MDVKKAILYAHGGSGNHGCEAIVRSSIQILRDKFNQFILFSNQSKEDHHYGLNELGSIKSPYSDISGNRFRYLFFLLKMKLLKDDYYFYREKYRELPRKTEDSEVAFSVGGDNYCYSGFDIELRAVNQYLLSNKIKIILWGCSIEPNFLTESLIEDLKQYSLIVARESITYKALQEKGISRIYLAPDPAFYLERKDLPLPEKFIENNTVGINISPLITKLERVNGGVLKNVKKLIQYILEHTEMNVALIPHVVWEHNDDRKLLKEIYESLENTDRVVIIEDARASEIKGFIARCRFMIAARTHASIAAYSQQVPTLVLGYSVKSKGIAKDLFGDDQNFVLPVQNLNADGGDLLKSFQWLMDNEAKILETYETKMPLYKSNGAHSYQVILENF